MQNSEFTAKSFQAAEEFLLRKIPLTEAMGIRVHPTNDGTFVIEAPVALNSNHLGTAFGGSINAVATLAGYGLLWMEIGDRSADIVIRESTIRFFQPIRQSIRATCTRPADDEVRLFHQMLSDRGRARLSLRVRVEEEGRLAAELQGTFVALRRADGK